MSLHQQQAEKSDHKRTWAGISNVCTAIKSLHSLADLVLGAEEPKTRSEGGLGKMQRSEGGLGKLQRSDVKSLHLHPVKIGCEYLAQIETAISIIYGKYVYTYGYVRVKK
jgi:hypothetical protein